MDRICRDRWAGGMAWFGSIHAMGHGGRSPASATGTTVWSRCCASAALLCSHGRLSLLSPCSPAPANTGQPANTTHANACASQSLLFWTVLMWSCCCGPISTRHTCIRSWREPTSNTSTITLCTVTCQKEGQGDPPRNQQLAGDRRTKGSGNAQVSLAGCERHRRKPEHHGVGRGSPKARFKRGTRAAQRAGRGIK